MKRLLLGLIVLAGCSKGSISIEAEPITGKVVDVDGRPVPGAIVAVQWVGTFNSFSESGTRCIRGDSVQADKSGRFGVSSWRKSYVSLDNVQALFVGYHDGYVDQDSPMIFGSGTKFGRLRVESKDVVVRLRSFHGTDEERRHFLGGVISGTSCEDPDSGGMRLLYKAISAEAAQLPVERAVPGQATLLELARTMAAEQ